MKTAMKLRDYQQKYINDVKRGEKNLVHLATGGGKSVIFLKFINECLKKDRPVLFIVYKNSILHQAVDKYFKEQDVSMMQGSNKWRMSKILACSVDTLTRKKPEQLERLFKHYKNIVVDEAHDCTAERYLRILPDRLDKNFTVLGLTATPYAIGKKGHTYWTNYIKHISVRELINKDWLVKPRCFVAETEMNTDVKKVAGEFNNKELFQKNDNMVIYSSIVDEYLKKGENGQAICFAVNRKHAKEICHQFISRGIKAVYADGDTPMIERKHIIKRFEKKEFQVLCNVDIFSTGLDTPIASVGIMARPTKSRKLWIQQCGRILRPYPGKEYAIILDHGGNVLRCGHPVEDFEAVLTDNEGDKDPVINMVVCDNCYAVFGKNQNPCPSCGFDNKALKEKKERELKEKRDQELKEYNLEKIEKAKQKEKDKKRNQWRSVFYGADPEVTNAFGALIATTDENKFIDKDLSLKVLNIMKDKYKPAISSLESEEIAEYCLSVLIKDQSPWRVLHLVYEYNKDTILLKFPEWFLKIKDEQQI